MNIFSQGELTEPDNKRSSMKRSQESVAEVIAFDLKVGIKEQNRIKVLRKITIERIDSEHGEERNGGRRRRRTTRQMDKLRGRGVR